MVRSIGGCTYYEISFIIYSAKTTKVHKTKKPAFAGNFGGR